MITTNFKNFKNFIGNLTVSSSIIYCSTQNSKEFVIKNFGENENPWREFSKNYQVKLDILNIDDYDIRIFHLLLINVYTALDHYIYRLKKDYFIFLEKEWKSDNGASFIDDLRKNFNLNKIDDFQSFEDFLLTIDYYRYIRNSIIHNSKKDAEKASEFRLNNSINLIRLKDKYGMKSVPSTLEEINFHDVKYFCRILLDYLPKIDSLLYPGDGNILNFLSDEKKNKYKKLKGERAKNYLINCLVNDLGLSYEDSVKIESIRSLA